ncbi:MAG: DUF3794 domain-containing protein [Clostridia bacterium]|nr:DUF3794 domain-containing protein [Clostridia bacterium]
MRVALHAATSHYFKPIYENEIVKEETMELVVPDVCADIGKILDIRGQLLRSSQKAKADEILICAAIEISIIYAADGNGKVQHLTAKMPLDMMVAVPGADENTKIVTKCELCNLDARTLNPRKLLIRANVSAHICCLAADKLVFWDNLCQDENASVYILQKEIEHTPVVCISEKSFVVSDEYRLSESGSMSVKMLSAQTEICVSDVKAVGNKVVIKAEANTSAVFLNEDDESLFDSKFSTQFSQIMELETYGESIMNTVCIRLRDAEFTMLSGRENDFICSAQYHMTAQAVSREAKCSAYIADAYSNEYKLTAETANMKLVKCLPEKTLMLNMRGKLQSRAALTEIMYAAISEICAEAEGSEISVRADVSGVGLSEGRELEAIELKLSANEKIELDMNQELRLKAVCCDKTAVLGMGANAEFSADVLIVYNIREYQEINAVCGLEMSEESILKGVGRPSLIVICSPREYDLWNLAKKYSSTMEMIENANKTADGFNVSRRPLLIPRAK